MWCRYRWSGSGRLGNIGVTLCKLTPILLVIGCTILLKTVYFLDLIYIIILYQTLLYYITETDEDLSTNLPNYLVSDLVLDCCYYNKAFAPAVFITNLPHHLYFYTSLGYRYDFHWKLFMIFLYCVDYIC